MPKLRVGISVQDYQALSLHAQKRNTTIAGVVRGLITRDPEIQIIKENLREETA